MIRDADRAGLCGMLGCGEVRRRSGLARNEALTRRPLAGDPVNGRVCGCLVLGDAARSRRQMDRLGRAARGGRHAGGGDCAAAAGDGGGARHDRRCLCLSLHWDRDIAAQVAAAMGYGAGFRLARCGWMSRRRRCDGSGGDQADGDGSRRANACKDHGVGCGLYTSPGYWKSYLNDTNALIDVPLWYALTTKANAVGLDDRAFGGWTRPAAKQFQTAPL